MLNISVTFTSRIQSENKIKYNCGIQVNYIMSTKERVVRLTRQTINIPGQVNAIPKEICIPLPTDVLKT